MSLFEVERTLPLTEKTSEYLDETFKQNPVALKLPIHQVTERVIVEKHQADHTPLIVMGLLVSLFAFLGFLAYMKKGD